MLYNIFRFLFRLTVKAYFRSIYVQGKDVVRRRGPIVFAANHASAFMDPILLAVLINRTLHFLARGDVFKNKMAAKIFGHLKMIPVYKPDLSPGEMHKNEMIFAKCFEYLKNGRTIMIFPEGTSRTERKLRDVKTGLARIALGAEQENDFDLGVQIIPIGINYSNPHHFKSDVFVNFGKPFLVNEYKDAFLNDEKDGVIQLTERVKKELEKRIVIIEDDRLEKLIQQIEVLYRSKLRDESKPKTKAHQDFYLSKDIVKAVEFFAENDPEKVLDFEKRIDLYLSRLKRLRIRDTQIRSSKTSIKFVKRFFLFFLGAPLFLYGLIVNLIPFKLAEFLSKRIMVRQDFIGSLKLAIGMFIFLFLYITEAVIFSSYTTWYWGLLFLISLYPSGVFTVNYLKNYYQARGTFKYLRIFIRKSDLITSLKTTRQELVDELESGKTQYQDYLKQSNSKK